MNRRCVITGMGVVAPNGHGLQEFEEALRQGRSGIRFIPELKALNFACRWRGSRRTSKRSVIVILMKRRSCQSTPTSDMPRLRLSMPGGTTGFEVSEGEDVDWDSGVIVGSGIGGMDTIADRSCRL